MIIFYLIFFYKTPLIIAIQEENLEIVNLLLSCPSINPNIKYILLLKFDNKIVNFFIV